MRFIKYSEYIRVLEVDVLDSNYVLSTMLKRLLTRRIILYASSLGISRDVGGCSYVHPTKRLPFFGHFIQHISTNTAECEKRIRHSSIRATV